MFERFNQDARRAVVMSEEEARQLGHGYIGTEHILLGLVHGGEAVGPLVLESMGLSLESVRSKVLDIVEQGSEPTDGHLPFTPRAKKVLELSLREALQLGHNYIGPEHILLGIIREGDGKAIEVLQQLGVEPSTVRQAVLVSFEGPGMKGRTGVGGLSGSPRKGSPPESASSRSESTPDLGAIEDLWAMFPPEQSIGRDSWTSSDRLGYGTYADAIASFIQHPETRPPLTVGIKGPWGAGKTSFMRMVQERLDPPLNPEATEWQFGRLRLNSSGLTRLGLTEHDEKSSGETIKSVLNQTRRGVDPGSADGEHFSETSFASQVDSDSDWRPTVWFNPWMYQSGEQIWAGLAHEIITQVTDRLPRLHKERFWLRLNLRRINTLALRKRLLHIVARRALPALALFIGAVFVAVIGWTNEGIRVIVPLVAAVVALPWGAKRVATGLNESAARTLPGIIDGSVRGLGETLPGGSQSAVDDPKYEDRMGYLYLLHLDLRRVLNLVATEEQPLVIFIDDLDRCSPGVVAQTIEAISLFLAGGFGNTIFVVALEPAVVAAHIEAAHKTLVDRLVAHGIGGWSALGWRFLEKVVQLPVSLPRPEPEDIADYVESMFRLPPSDPTRLPDDGTVAPGSTLPSGHGERFAEPTVAGAAERDEAIAREVSRLEDSAITVENIPALRREVENRFSEDVYTVDEARRMSFSVVSRLFSDVYSDSDPLVKRIITDEALALPSRNPRDIKRLINLFRFYAMIANERKVLNYDSPEALRDSFHRVARLCVLAIRWPEFLSLLGARASDEMSLSGRLSNYTVLEIVELGQCPTGWLKDRLGDQKRAEALQEFVAVKPGVGDLLRLLV